MCVFFTHHIFCHLMERKLIILWKTFHALSRRDSNQEASFLYQQRLLVHQNCPPYTLSYRHFKMTFFRLRENPRDSEGITLAECQYELNQHRLTIVKEIDFWYYVNICMSPESKGMLSWIPHIHEQKQCVSIEVMAEIF